MGLMNEIGNILEQYKGASASAPPPNVEQHFSQVAQNVPQSAVSKGLSDAFRSNETSPFGQMIAQLFGKSNGDQKAGILNHLLGSFGPTGLTGIPAELSSLLEGHGSVTPDQANQVSPGTVQDLAERARQQDPSIIDMAGDFYSKHPTLVKSLGAGALAIVLSRISHHA